MFCLSPDSEGRGGEDEDVGLGDQKEDGAFSGRSVEGRGCGEVAGVEATLEGAEGKVLRVFTWRFLEAGTELGWTPGWSHCLGKVRWVLGGVRISEKEEVRVPVWKEGLGNKRPRRWRRSCQGRKRRARIFPAALRACTVPCRHQDVVNFQCLCAKRTPLVIHAVLTGGRNHFGD